MSVRDLLMAAAGAVAPGGAAYRYWRLYVTALNSGGSQLYIFEVELRASVGGADLTNYGTTPVAESSFLDNGEGTVYLGAYTIDNYLSDGWVTPTGAIPAWVRYDLGTPKSVVEFAILPYPSAGYCPRDFKIQGSTDGSSWLDVKSFTAVAAWTGWQAFNLT